MTKREEKKGFFGFFLGAIMIYINLMNNLSSIITKFTAYKPYKLISQLENANIYITKSCLLCC